MLEWSAGDGSSRVDDGDAGLRLTMGKVREMCPFCQRVPAPGPQKRTRAEKGDSQHYRTEVLSGAILNMLILDYKY
jgi:hypothetical protein